MVNVILVVATFGSWLFTLKNMYPRRLRYGQSDEILTLSSIETHPHYMLILHLFMVWYLNETMQCKLLNQLFYTFGGR